MASVCDVCGKGPGFGKRCPTRTAAPTAAGTRTSRPCARWSPAGNRQRLHGLHLVPQGRQGHPRLAAARDAFPRPAPHAGSGPRRVSGADAVRGRRPPLAQPGAQPVVEPAQAEAGDQGAERGREPGDPVAVRGQPEDEAEHARARADVADDREQRGRQRQLVLRRLRRARRARRRVAGAAVAGALLRPYAVLPPYPCRAAGRTRAAARTGTAGCAGGCSPYGWPPYPPPCCP